MSTEVVVDIKDFKDGQVIRWDAKLQKFVGADFVDPYNQYGNPRWLKSLDAKRVVNLLPLIETIVRSAVNQHGTRGPRGPQGPPGYGIPTGGRAGYVLKKISNADYDTYWGRETGGEGGGASGPIYSDDILDSTSLGRSLIVAASPFIARTAIGAGTASTYDVPTTGDATSSQVVKGDDTRLTDARPPSTHTHTASAITDFAEGVEDYCAAMLTQGTHTGLTVTYNDNGASPGTIDIAFNTFSPTLAVSSSTASRGTLTLAPANSGASAFTTTNYIDIGAGSQQYSATFYVSSDGIGIPYLGWGTTPTAPIDIVRTDTQIKLAYASGGSYDCTVNGDLSGLTLNAFSGGAVRLQTAGTNRLFANASGVGLGTTSPGARLDVRTGATTTVGQVIRGATSQTADLTQWQTSAGAVVAAVTADGRIGIRTVPISNSTLHIKCDTGAKQGFIVTNGDSVGIQTWFGFTTGDGPLGTGNDEYVNFYKDASGWIWNSDKGGTGTARAVRWTHAGTERMRINGTGIGFLGKTPAAQQAGGAATAGGTYGATEQGMLQKAYDALRTFGLLS